MSVTLVIPCYNEASRLKLEIFEKYKNINLVFVNDGSQDETQKLLEGILSQNCLVLNLPQNVGKSEAVRLGILKAFEAYPDSEWIGFWDADLATPLDQVEYLLKFSQISSRLPDAVFSSRVLRLGSVIQRQFLRHLLGRFFVTYSSLMLGTHAYDSQCGAKLFKRIIVPDIFLEPFISRWFFDLEIIQRMAKKNLQILECPLEKWFDIEGSKVKPIKDGLKAFFEIIKIRRIYGKTKNIQ